MTGVVNLTVFLTSANILGPIAGMGFLVVEEPADAELLGGGPVPTSPVSGAGGLVPEDPVEPVAVQGPIVVEGQQALERGTLTELSGRCRSSSSISFQWRPRRSVIQVLVVLIVGFDVPVVGLAVVVVVVVSSFASWGWTVGATDTG